MCNIEAIKEKKKQLRWQCRRGMLEIDLLLDRYLSNSYDKASQSERQLFDQFLSENDQQLFVWLTGQEQPAEIYQNLVFQLRNASTE